MAVVYQRRMSDIDPVELARALVKRPSITPADEGALDIVEAALSALGFKCVRLPFEGDGAEPVDNLYARYGSAAPHFCFAGHTDVVPPGPEDAWTTPPFAADYTFNTMQLDPGARSRLETHYYEAGHMMYVHRPSLDQLRKDLAAYYDRALTEAGGGSK